MTPNLEIHIEALVLQGFDGHWVRPGSGAETIGGQIAQTLYQGFCQ